MMAPDGRTVQVRLPARFYDDHAARDLPSGEVVKRLAREVDVRLDREALDDLRSDAEHYVTSPGWEIEVRGLISSAKATLRRLDGVEIPEDEPTRHLPNGQRVPGPWSTIGEVKAHHRAREVDWFAAGGFFRTRIESGMLHGRLFLTSEQFVPSSGDPDPRRWTVRCVSDAGDISTLGPFNAMTEREAQQMVGDLLDRPDE